MAIYTQFSGYKGRIGIMKTLLTIVIEDKNPDVLLNLIVLIIVLWIIVQIICIIANKKEIKKYQRCLKLIKNRHEMIEQENERRSRLAKKLTSNSDSM